MKKKMILERTSNCYGWTPQNIVINEHMAAHVRHHVNNPLSIISAKSQKLIRFALPELKILGDEIAVQIDRIVQYMKALEELSCEKAPDCKNVMCPLVREKKVAS